MILSNVYDFSNTNFRAKTLINTFFTIFAKKAIREQAIPFELSARNDDYSYENMVQSMKQLQRAAIKNGTADMSLEEINKEIYG